MVRNTGSSYVVRIDGSNEEANCRVKGNFRIKGIRTTNPVAVGDHVTVTKAADDADYITAISPRRNYIIRRASNLSKESHILAANLDLAALVVSLREPSTPTTFIDRILATAEAYGIPAMLILNKADIWDADDRELAEGMKILYSSIGYQVAEVSARKGEGIDTLRDILRDKVTLLAGNSGVGKSSLINALVRYEGIRFVFISPEELRIPDYLIDMLKEKGIPYHEVISLDDVMPQLDLLYMTRVQKERFFNEEDYVRLKDFYILDKTKMERAREDMLILHPLPRVNEISVEVDNDPRAVYFKQVQYGVYVRMALILTLLNISV